MKLFSTIAVFAASFIGTASATVISYNTGGSAFTVVNGMATNSTAITVNSGGSSATLTYTPITGGTFDDQAPGTNISYGTFTLTFTGADTQLIFPTFTFLLDVNETGPYPSQQVITATSFGGTVSSNSSNVNVFYAPISFSLPSASATPRTDFLIINPTQVVAPTTNGGASTIQGFAVGASTPEPGTMFLLGAGLLGIGFTSRKKFAKRS